jgi:hypothetical protein
MKTWLIRFHKVINAQRTIGELCRLWISSHVAQKCDFVDRVDGP